MALAVLLKRSKLTELQTRMKTLTDAAAGFEAREKELEGDISNAKTAEERSACEAAVTAFEAERTKNTGDTGTLRAEIDALEAEIRTLEAAQKPPKDAGGEPGNRTGESMNETRDFFGRGAEERRAMFEREDVKQFCQRVRELKTSQRSVTGAELGIPVVFLPILRDQMAAGSKLMQYVTLQPLKGKARQNIAGTVPEAIWTEAIANLNEISIEFNQIEMDGYKVAGFTAVPNSDLEDDDDLQLVTTILTMMGQSLGKAFDKAAVYGTGAKMPVGFVTRLAASAQPAWWGSNQGAFADLHASNVLKLNINSTTGAAFFTVLIAALGIAKPNYSDGAAVWLMNRKTHIDLMTKALAFDSAAALVAGMNNTMPVIGGTIVELDFMSDYDIAGGFLKLEHMVERAGASIQSSDIPLFLQDQTVFKAVARYDGKPAIGEGFVIVNYNNADPAVTKTFATDYANTDIGTLIVTTAAGASGKTVLTVAGNTDGAVLMYKLAGGPLSIQNGATLTGYTALPANKTISAATGEYVTVAELDAAGKAVKAGAGICTAGA